MLHGEGRSSNILSLLPSDPLKGKLLVMMYHENRNRVHELCTQF